MTIITAWLSSLNAEANRQRMMQMRADLEGYASADCSVEWLGFHELAFAVTNLDREAAIRLGAKYDQDAIVIKSEIVYLKLAE